MEGMRRDFRTNLPVRSDWPSSAGGSTVPVTVHRCSSERCATRPSANAMMSSFRAGLPLMSLKTASSESTRLSVNAHCTISDSIPRRPDMSDFFSSRMSTVRPLRSDSPASIGNKATPVTQHKTECSLSMYFPLAPETAIRWRHAWVSETVHVAIASTGTRSSDTPQIRH
ncbi:MAG: hypothetical protein JW395_3636 [Nitrospira sp.]|nr:hypothetical protein [Nitrospira sp.]